MSYSIPGIIYYAKQRDKEMTNKDELLHLSRNPNEGNIMISRSIHPAEELMLWIRIYDRAERRANDQGVFHDLAFMAHQKIVDLMREIESNEG